MPGRGVGAAKHLCYWREQASRSPLTWFLTRMAASAESGIAQVLTWLAIGEHDWLNGQHIVVDGGFTSGIGSHWIDRTTSPR